MKNFFVVLFVLFLVSCGNTEEKKNAATSTNLSASPFENGNSQIDGYAAFGKTISTEQTVSSEEMYGKYKNLKIGDTLKVKFSAEVAKVCKRKGCWMKLRLPEGKTSMVKFKDYAFFMPKEIEEKEAIVHGKAYLTVVSVEEQRHYAKDAGKSTAEIVAITQPKRTLSFLADGVLIKQ